MYKEQAFLHVVYHLTQIQSSITHAMVLVVSKERGKWGSDSSQKVRTCDWGTAD